MNNDRAPGLSGQMTAESVSDEDGFGTPRCDCADCRDDEEAGCAVVMTGPEGQRVQCGMQGGHEGSCDFWEKPHDERGNEVVMRLTWSCSCGAGGVEGGWRNAEWAVFGHLQAKEDGTHSWVIEPSTEQEGRA